jgi:SAM-dependent methyltransferase
MSWNAGYVTDVAYLSGYYPEQSPHHLALCCLLGNVTPSFMRRSDRLSYVEFGCGRGFGALSVAASNPNWQVVAIDFMPAHIEEAREMADEAGIGNVRFIEADIATLDPQTLPEIDVASAHGVWSWVADPVRDGMVRILAERMRPGAMLHLSYNALPAWQGALGLQRLLHDAGRQLGGRSDRQIAGAVATAKALAAAGAVHLDHTPSVKTLLEELPRMPPEYLAHEYMNASWRPCFHADVANAVAGAKLDYVASGHVLENFPAMILTEQQRAICDGISDPALRELAKDICLSRGLRHDVFIRGPRRIGDAARDAALRDLTVTLSKPAAAFSYELKLAAGTVALARSFYEPVVAALDEGPQQIGALLARGATRPGADNPAGLVGALVGSGQAMLVARPDAGLGEAAARLNDVVAARLLGQQPGRAEALASLRLGAALRCSTEDHVTTALLRQFGVESMPDTWADHLGLSNGSAERATFMETADAARRRQTSVWQHAGII